MIQIDENYKINSYGNDVVILDICNDTYKILENGNKNESFELLHFIINNELSEICSLGIITETTLVSKANEKKYFLEERWLKPSTRKIKYHKIKLLMCYFSLKSCEKTITKNGFLGVRERIRKIKKERTNKNKEKLDETMSYLNAVYPFSNNESNCLTYSFCLVLLLLKHNVDAKLVIGVRTRPFYSHAWVEVGGEVISDDKFIRNKLSVIWEI